MIRSRRERQVCRILFFSLVWSKNVREAWNLPFIYAPWNCLKFALWGIFCLRYGYLKHWVGKCPSSSAAPVAYQNHIPPTFYEVGFRLHVFCSLHKLICFFSSLKFQSFWCWHNVNLYFQGNYIAGSYIAFLSQLLK